jgi:diguanylate cyclase (GGDEF)-like protein/PAS domain S-box-containing protein
VSESTKLSSGDQSLYRTLFDAAGDAIIVCSEQGAAIECNQAALDLFGCTRQQLLGSSPIDWSPEFQPNGRRSDELAAEVFSNVKAKGMARFDWHNRRADGTPFPVDATVRLAKVDDRILFVVISRDITKGKQAEALRQDALDRFRQLTELVPGVVYQFRLRPDGSACMPYVSGAFKNMFHVNSEEVREDATKALMRAHPDDVDSLMASIQTSAKDMTPWQHEYRLKFDDGTVRWVYGNSQPHREADGSILWHGFITDITERKRTELALQESEERWKFAIEGAGDGLWDWNVQTGAAFYSQRYKEMFGYSDADFGITSDEWSKRIHPDDAPGVFAVLQPYMDGKPGSATVEFRMLCKDGSWKWTLGRGMVVSRDADGKPVRMIGTNADITERKRAEVTIRELAFYDSLTKLPNRHLLNDRLSQAMATCTRSGCYGAVMFLDLDNFKPLNDMHGHAVGDLLLVEVAERLRNGVRKIDTVSRFGGDEFVVVINGLDEERTESTAQAGFIAEKIRRTLSEPYQLTVKHGGKADTTIEHHCTVSVGVALFLNHESSQDDILKWADAAMYQAKDAGRNSIRFIDTKV